MEEYINSYEGEIKNKLITIRDTVMSIIPESKQIISYGMPAFKLKEYIVYFAVCKNHIGFYPTNEPIEYFKEELSNYETTKGSIHFKLNEDIPVDLIKKIVLFRLEMIKKK